MNMSVLEMGMNEVGMNLGQTYMFRSAEYNDMIEKRQVFLRSYQFSRKKNLTERIRASFFRMKRVIWVRLKSVKKLRKFLCFRIKHGLFYYNNRRRRMVFRRIHSGGAQSHGAAVPWQSSSSCFW